MYKLFIIDRNGKKLNVFQSNSEASIDSFTTHFESKFEFLKELGLENRGFRVKIEKLKKDEDNGVEIEFLTKEYDGVSELNKGSNEVNFISYSLLNVEEKILKTFFLDELKKYEVPDMNNYSKDRYKKLRSINYHFDTIARGEKDNVSLFSLMRVYFDDNYQNLRRFYIYLTDMNKNPVISINKNEDKNDLGSIIEIMKQKIRIAKKSDIDVFTLEDLPMDVDSGIVIIKEEDKLEDKMDNISKKMEDRDIDELYSELDMFLDSEGIDDPEVKMDYINKRIKKF